MTTSDPLGDRPGGLRERKKARTRASIQQEAMRLFRERGYEGTTVEDIAEAAEVSPSTFFRYFPTKEDVVLRDDYDELLLQGFLGQPPEMTPIQAVRATLRSFASLEADLSEEQRELESLRTALTFSVPEVRARMIDELTRTFRLLAEAVAERAQRTPDDHRVRAFTGAVLGVMMTTLEPLAADPGMQWTALIPALDEAMGYLEQGLPL
ncbi:MAG: TetR family transcriptional regulator [Candidatus Dormiibacterota bacterium]